MKRGVRKLSSGLRRGNASAADEETPLDSNANSYKYSKGNSRSYGRGSILILILVILLVSAIPLYFWIPDTSPPQKLDDRKPDLSPTQKVDDRKQQESPIKPKPDIEIRESQENVAQEPKDPVPSEGKEKFVLYRCHYGCGGWGDRTKAMVTGYVIALVTDRTFLVDIRHPCSLEGFIEPNKVPWDRKLPPDLSEIVVNWEVKKYDNREFAKDLLIGPKHLNELFPEDVIVVTGQISSVDRFKDNPIYAEKIKSLGYDLDTFKQQKMFGKIYNDLFKLAPKVQAKLEDFKEASGKKNGYHLICAQLRMGSPYVPYDPVMNKRESVPAMWDFIKAEIKKLDKFKVFITTDAKDVRTEAKEVFGDDLIDNEGEIYHLDAHDKEKTCPGTAKMLLDFHGLAFCDTLVISSSMFGFGAAYLKENYGDIYMFYDGKVNRFV